MVAIMGVGFWYYWRSLTVPRTPDNPARRPTHSPAAAPQSAPSSGAPTHPALASSKLSSPAAYLAHKRANAKALSRAQKQAAAATVLKHMNAVVNRRQSGLPHPVAGLPRHQGITGNNDKHQRAIDELLARLGNDTRLEMDNVSGTLRYLRGDLAPLGQSSPAYQSALAQQDHPAMAAALLGELAAVLNIVDPAREFRVERTLHDELGMTHVVLSQYYQDTPVWGAQIGVHFASSSQPIEVSGLYAVTPVLPRRKRAEISAAEAIATAQAAVGSDDSSPWQPQAERMIYWDLHRAPEMTWRVDVTRDMDESWQIFVAANGGDVVHKYHLTQHEAVAATAADLAGVSRTISVWRGNATYYAIDTTAPFYNSASSPPNLNAISGALIALNAQQSQNQFVQTTSTAVNQWDSAAVSLLFNLRQIESYFYQTHNRLSINDKGMNIIGVIHYGANIDNAHWNPTLQLMLFGDGDIYFKNLAISLDVTAHELTHGIISHSAALIYENQSGAINEHLADFFAAMIDRNDWLIGEDAVKIAGQVGLRDLQNPGNPQVLSPQPAAMSAYEYLPNTAAGDNGGVHRNSGILNRMSYLLADGNQGIGRSKSEKIVYRALINYLTSRAQFIDYRRALISAAEDLYGTNSLEVTAVKAAFDAVEIFDSDSSQTPTPGIPTTGVDQIIFQRAEAINQSGTDYLYRLILEANGQLYYLTSNYVTNTRHSITGDGSFLLYVSAAHNLWSIDGSFEERILDGGFIATIAMSKDLRFIAYTTTDYEPSLTLVDVAGNTFEIVPLRIVQPDGEATEVDFADILTFNFQGDTLVFDAVSTIPLPSGERVSVWGIYSLRVADRAIHQIVPLAPDLDIGNPVFSHTINSHLLVDLILKDLDINGVVALDYISNRQAIIGGSEVHTQPSYVGDDNHFLFRYYSDDLGIYNLFKTPFGNDKFTSDIPASDIITTWSLPIGYPLGFRAGSYTAAHGRINVVDGVDFGAVKVGANKQVTLTIANNGNGDLELFSISLAGATTQFSHNGFSRHLSPGGQYSFAVEFSPTSDSTMTSTLNLGSTDPDFPLTEIQLQGIGVSPPMVSVQPQNQTVYVSETARFSLVASGYPPPDYHWQRLPRNALDWIDLEDGDTYSGTQTNSLNIVGTTITMTGDQFRCLVTNAEGSDTSNSAVLMVIFDTIPPQLAITQPTAAATYMTLADSIHIEGTAGDNVAVVEVTWSNNRGGSGVAVGTDTWSIANLALFCGANQITVTARDAENLAGSAALTIVYGITQSLDLKAGWNLISVQVEPCVPGINAILQNAGIPPADGAAWKWTNPHLEKADEIHPMQGYWLYLKQPAILPITGLAPDRSSRELTQGWHLVGPVGNSIAFQNHAAVDGTIWRWNGRHFIPVQVLEKGYGYWLHCPLSSALLELGD